MEQNSGSSAYVRANLAKPRELSQHLNLVTKRVNKY